MSELTDRQRRFVEEYLVDCNGTQAAIRAGYAAKNASQQAYQLLEKTSVQEALREAMAKLSTRAEITAERVLEELRRIAFSDLRQVMSWGPGGVLLRESVELTEEEASTVAEVAETKDGVRLKLHDKISALDKLAKRLGLYAPERVEHSGPGGKPVQTETLSDLDIARRIAFVLAKGQRALRQSGDGTK